MSVKVWGLDPELLTRHWKTAGHEHGLMMTCGTAHCENESLKPKRIVDCCPYSDSVWTVTSGACCKPFVLLFGCRMNYCLADL